MISFDEEFLELQIHFETPEKMSQDLEQDFVTVTFYGVEFFQSADQSEVEFGTKLSMAILRQVDLESPEVNASIKSGIFCSWVTGLSLLLIPFFICVGQSMLPLFMYLVTIQLISHMALFNTQMPAPVIVYLRQLLDVTRLNFLSDFASNSQSALNFVFGQAGYNSVFVHENLTKALTLAMCLTATLAAISVATDQFIAKRGLSRPAIFRKCYWPSSRTLITLASLTFAYAFLEIFLCALLSLDSGEKSAFTFSGVVTGVIFVPFVFLALHFVRYDKRYKM